MKLRKHKGNKLFKITWAQRTPVVIETHSNSDGTTRKVQRGGESQPRQSVIAEGHNPTSTLNAFLFGRDRTNILAQIREITPENLLSDTLKRSPRRPSLQMLEYAVALSSSMAFGGPIR